MDITSIAADELYCFVEGNYGIYTITSEIATAPAIYAELAEIYFNYPFYIVFEGYDDVKSEVITAQNIEWIGDIGTVLTNQGNTIYHKGVPSFRATIANTNELLYFLRHHYRYVLENNFLVATQHKHVTYKPVIQDTHTQSFAYLNAMMHTHFLMFGERGQQVILGTTTEATEEMLYAKLLGKKHWQLKPTD